MKYRTLKQQAITGAKWSGTSIASTTVLNFITTAILARLLSPEEFGLLGMMTIFIGLIGCLADAGVSNAIIYHQDATKSELSSLYWINILMGGILFTIVVLSHPLAVAYFDEPRLSTYLPLIAATLIITPIGQQFRILLRKDLAFRTLTGINILSTSVACVTAITVALFGLGIWSLVFRPVVLSLVATTGFVFVGIRRKWLPDLCFQIGSIRKYLRFGLFQMGERLLDNLRSNVDYLIIGRFMGAEALGFYSLAYSLITLPLSKINPIITGIAFPTFAKMQSDDWLLKTSYLKMLRYLSTLTFPVMFGMLIVAPVFVPTVYGSRWLPAVHVLQVLCVVGTLKSLGNPLGSLLLAKGRADIGFYFNVFTTVVIAAGCMIGVKWGTIGVAYGIATTTLLLLWPVDIYVRWQIVGMKLKEYFNSFKFPAMASGLMIVLLWITSFLLNHMSNTLNLFLQVLVGSLFYIFFHWIFDRSFSLEFRETVLNRN